MADRRWRWNLPGDVAVIAVFAALLAWMAADPAGLSEQALRVDLKSMNAGMSWAHPLGTDAMGRDLLARLTLAVRDSVLPLWGAVLVANVAGIALALGAIVLSGGESGGASARRRGLAGSLDTGAVTVAAIPLGLAVFVLSAVYKEAGLVPLLAGLGAGLATRSYLLTRDLHRQDRALAWWQADVALGGGPVRRLWRYGVISAWRRPLVEGLGLQMRAAVALEAGLAYLGFGVTEPQPSFGNILAAHFDRYLKGDWSVLVAVAAMLVLVAVMPSRLAGLAAGFAGARARRRERLIRQPIALEVS